MSLAGARGGMLTVRLVLFTGAVLGAVQARCAIPPINEESAAQANYRCPPADTPPQRATTAVALASHTYSKNDLACAADFRVANADSAPEDLGGTITALESLASYAEYIRRLEAFDLGHIDALEIEARLDHSRQQAVTLLPRARTRWPEDARILTLTAMIDLSLAADDQEGDARLRARESFEKAIKLDPHALNGAPQRALARMYLDLPPLLGGDTAKALEYFTAAREEAPDDIRILNGIAACDLELGRTPEAAAALSSIVKLGPTSEADRQLFVDEWRTGEGLATRLGESTLAADLGAKRSKLLRSHPELLSRNSAVVLGHGGSNPVTGVPQYVGDVTRAPAPAPAPAGGDKPAQ